MKTFVAALSAVVLLGTGCAVHVPYASSRHASTASGAKRCPPGHTWSDGSCHDRGKGNERKGR